MHRLTDEELTDIEHASQASSVTARLCREIRELHKDLASHARDIAGLRSVIASWREASGADSPQDLLAELERYRARKRAEMPEPNFMDPDFGHR